MFNHATLVGRITADPEVRYTTSGIAVVSFRLAVDRARSNQQGERETDFIDCVAWRQSAEFMGKYVTKGRLLLVDGHIQVRDWAAQDGTKRRSVEVIAETVRGLDRPKEGGEGGRGPSGPPQRGDDEAPPNDVPPSGGDVMDITDPFADQ